MRADDPRHGTNAGYSAGCRDECCAEASWRYHKQLTLEHSRGRRRLVDSTGTRRRIEALMRLGYSGQVIAAELGKSDWDDVRSFRTRPMVNRATAENVATVYERLSMRLPVGSTRFERQIISRTRNHAEKRGWLPPLAWVDIDDPDERPDMTAVDNLPDPVVVERILAGDWRLKATPAERAEVVERWTGSLNQLETLTGWNIARDQRQESAA